MCYRAMPHQSLMDTPAFLTHGKDFQFRQQGGLLSGWRKMEPHKSRLQILNEMRHEVTKRYKYQRMKAAKHQGKDEELLERLEVGQVVLLRLTPGQHEKLSKSLGGAKLLPWWSLPMRVLHVNTAGTTATLRCLVCGFTTQSHIERCRRVLLPFTEPMMEEWKRVCEGDLRLFNMLGSKWFDIHDKTMHYHHAQGRTVVGGTDENPKPPLSKHEDNA